MKIQAIIADDRHPEGWRETFPTKRHDDGMAQAMIQMTAMVERYNHDLAPNEKPRRLLSLTLEEHSEDEAWDMGNKAHGHPLAEYWSAGWNTSDITADEAFSNDE